MQIHELPEAASVADSDLIAIDTGTNTKRFTILGLLRRCVYGRVDGLLLERGEHSADGEHLTPCRDISRHCHDADPLQRRRSRNHCRDWRYGVQNSRQRLCADVRSVYALVRRLRGRFLGIVIRDEFTNVDRGWLRVVRIA